MIIYFSNNFKKAFFLLFSPILLSASVYSQSLKVVDWNLLNFPGNSGVAREVHYRTVLTRLDPDILVCQEITSDSGVQQFLNNVLNSSQPGKYAAALFFDGPDSDNILFYKPSVLQLIFQTQIPTDLRDISEYVLKVLTGPSTGTVFRVYSLHLKSGTATSDKNQRNQEANILRDYLNELPANSLFLVCGDFNLQASSEASFQILTSSENDNDGRLKDPINLIGTWHDNADFAKFHTQSTRATQFGGGASGGLDDRFDFILTSYAFDTDIFLRYEQNSYSSYGNDGYHFNLSINAGTNYEVGSVVANSLFNASDHLPVVLEITPQASVDHYTLTIQSSPNGTTNPSPGNYFYDPETVVQVTATPDSYSVFTDWTGDASGTTNALSITMNRDKVIKANFRYIYAVSASGEKVLNRSFSQAEYINVLTWEANPANTGLDITKYKIYLVDDETYTLLTEVNNNQRQYFHRKVGQETLNYAIVAVTGGGREGAPALITVQ